MKMTIYANYKKVLAQVEEACRRANRPPRAVTLLPVSKTRPISMLEELYQEGVRCFGENYVQELTPKSRQLPDDVQWHMIGHLQRNKVKAVVSCASMIHSLDSMRLAQAIEEQCAKLEKKMDVLIEINCGEESKFGISFDEAPAFAARIGKLSHLCLRGLMTSAPFVENPEDNRKYFQQMRQLCVDINEKNIDNIHMDVLSMGMTNDYIIAVEEGATHVRVGTAIFGEREYP